jgi:zinc ribbon protein
MADTCNCGAQLADNALFCHKCGRPQRDLPEVDSTGSMPVMKIEPVYPAVNFSNGLAMRIALLMAVGGTAVFFLPMLNWMAAGFFAALLYRKRTGYLLSTEAGVRLGWITGVLMFAIVLLMLTIWYVTVQQSGGFDALPPDVKAALGTRFQQSMKAFENVWTVVRMLMLSFVSITLFSMAGGVLGARLSRREP